MSRRQHVATRRRSYAPRQTDVAQRDARSVLLETMSEDDLLARVTDALTMAGYRWTHVRRSDRAEQMGHRGIPDLTIAGNGRFLMLELKAEGGTVDEDQRAWLDALGAAGVDARVLRPSDLVAFERELGLL